MANQKAYINNTKFKWCDKFCYYNVKKLFYKRLK